MFALFLVGLAIGWLLSRYIFGKIKRKGVPPGPTPLPIIGNAHQIDFVNMHVTFADWCKTYGELVYVELFRYQMIILNSYDVVKESLIKQGENFAARPRMWVFTFYSDFVPLGYIIPDGWFWKEQRRHALHTLRDFGLGRTMLEEKIQFEVLELFAEFDRQSMLTGDSVNVVIPFKFAVVNIIYNMLFGQRFDHGDPTFDWLQGMVQRFFKNTSKLFVCEFFPPLRYFANFFGYNEFLKLLDDMKEHFGKLVDDHQAQIDDGTATEPAEDFVYAYLFELKKRADEAQSSFSRKQLLYGLWDLFAAGFETTATTLSWMTVYLTHHPEIQEKMFAEIVEQVGGTPNMSDRIKLPYCQAVVAETQRIGNIVPFGVFRSVHGEAQISGYRVPKRCIITVNHWSIMNDEKRFPEPRQFKPDRFIRDDGSYYEPEGFMPFSVGKRSCLGEGMARMELFLFATSLLYRYKIKPSEDGLPSLEPNVALTRAPKDFTVELEKR